jgi:hypothetical protein
VEAARVELDREVDQFVKLSTDLHRVLDGRNKHAAGKLWALHSDLRAGSGQFADAYEEVVHQPLRDPRAPRDIYGPPAHQRLVVATKALVYFVRSYQDGLVGSANVLSGGAWGRYTSMGNALDRNGLVSQLAKEVAELTEYRDWFAEWRDVRNAMKSGIGQVTRSTPGMRAEIQFWSVGHDGQRGQRLVVLRMVEIRKALWLSGAFSKAIAHAG